METNSTTPPDRATMNGKPVLWRPAKTVLNLHSKFAEKLLCDGLTFSTGDACAFSCTFCYVPAMMAKAAYAPDGDHSQMVVRRQDALRVLREQLTVKMAGSHWRPRFADPNDERMVFASPLVDVAANMDLARETAEACALILELTHWHIRLLSKSPLLREVPRILERMSAARAFDREEVRERMVFGFSTGTLDDCLAAAFEKDCPKVSKRVEALHWLQDEGYRTFGMVCPSLPQRDYKAFAQEMAFELQEMELEHVWAEVINVRGESMTRTVHALREAGYGWEARELQEVSGDKARWEQYARATFEGHEGISWRPRLRFLQYVTPATAAWWDAQRNNGAVPLGAAASPSNPAV